MPFRMQTNDDESEKNTARLTTIGGADTSERQLYWGVFLLSIQSFGNQHTQLDIFQEKIVREYKWLSTSQFNEMKSLCWALPGPTIYQMIITLSTLKLQSPLAGFVAFVIFNVPSWLILLGLGTLADYYVTEDYHDSIQMRLTFMGFNAAAAGVMVRSLLEYLQENWRNISTVMITLAAAMIFVLQRSSASIVFCLIAGAIFSLYMPIETKHEMSARSKNLFHNINHSRFLGQNSMLIFVAGYTLLWLLSSFYPDSVIYAYMFVFYFCGTFIIGPATAIFAFFYAYFIELDLISEPLVWIGFPFSLLIPGSVVNGGIYFGVLLDGVRGMILAAVCLYLPTFTTLYGMLPQWKYYRNKPGVQRITKGLSCVSTGLLFGMIILSLEHCVAVDLSSTLTIFIVSLFLNYISGFYSFAIILLGGILANVRRWGLIYYRGLPDTMYM